MAYKFQLGKARMSGSLEQEGDLTVASGSGADVIGVESSLGSGVFLAQLGFDGSTNTGKLEIADGSSGDTVFSVLDILSGSAMNTLAGPALGFNQSSGVMSVNVDSSTIEVSSDALQLVNAGVSNAKLANLAQGSIKVGDGSNRPSDLDVKTSGQIIVGNGTTIASVAVSGDATLASGGALTIANGAISNAKLASLAEGSIKVGNSSNVASDLDAKTSGQIIVGNGTTIASVAVSGDAALAANGALTIANGAISNAKLASLAQGSIKVGNASNVASDVDAKTDGQILVGDGTTLNSVAISGDVSLSNAGLVTIQPGAVESGMLNNNVISGQTELTQGNMVKGDELFISDAGVLKKIGVDSFATDLLQAASNADITPSADFIVFLSGSAVGDTKKESLADLATAQAGGGIDATSGVFSVSAAQTGITSLLATDIKIGEDNQTKIDFETPDEIHFYANNTEQVFVSDGVFGPETDSAVDLGTTTERFKDAFVDSLTVTNDVTIAGNLTVTGATTEIQQAFVVTSSVQFEGLTPDGNEISLTSADPTADRTITLPDLDGHIPLIAGAIGNANVTAAEFSLLDGSAQLAAGFSTDAPVAADGFLHNDNGTLKFTTIGTLTDALDGDGITANGAVLDLDINALSNSLTVLAQADLIAVSDNSGGGTTKKVAFTHFEDAIFGNISGQASVAAGGALSLDVSAITAQTAMTGDVADADELMISDGGVLKRVDFSVFRDAVFKDVSGQVNASSGGAFALEVAAISAQTDIAAAIVGTDQLLINDGGALRRTDVSRIATFVGENLAEKVNNTITGAVTLTDFSAGRILLVDSSSGAYTITLPTSANHEGEIVKIKKISAPADNNDITIDANGSQTIDGSLSIILESPRAAVSLISDGSNWHVM